MVMDYAQASSKRLNVEDDGIFSSVQMRVQEYMYGHRILNEQVPYMIVLEALTVYASKKRGSTIVSSGYHEKFIYEVPYREKLRFLLFQDRNLEQIISDTKIPLSYKFKSWKESVNKQYQPSIENNKAFDYLEEIFDSLHNLHQAVKLLKSLELDIINSRRWTSRFLSVSGPDMILPDFNIKGNNWSYDRRFFARGGELIYLMLNRSSHAKRVKKLIEDTFLNKDDQINKIARILSGQQEDKKSDLTSDSKSEPSDSQENNKINSSQTTIGYLPYHYHESYDLIASDWCKILESQLPKQLKFEPLFRITGINLLGYLIARTKAIRGAEEPTYIIADLTDGENRKIREAAKTNFNQHRFEAQNAVKCYIEIILSENDRWKSSLESNNIGEAKKAIKDCFYTKELEEKAESVEKLKDDFVNLANKRSRNNINDYLLPLSRNSGLVTTRQGIGPWFAIDDKLLVALVLASVDEAVELQDFLACLHKKYGLIIGPVEAREAFGEIRTEAYNTNLVALEKRLTQLSLTKRLSDDCAFVMNPYTPKKEYD
ncbi:MAG: hypothetical protein OXC02_02160 [Rhodobacteraceae bacterium]|nr:hypothetical protein [Paracoccaceae bacterium]